MLKNSNIKRVKSKKNPATLKEAVQGRDYSRMGTVLGIDIEQFKHSIDLFKYSLDYAEAIVNTVREPLIILNKELKVITANRAFYSTFKIVPEKLENRPLYELGKGELNIPKLKRMLHKVLTTGTSFENYEIEYHVPKIGKRVLLLNARKFYRQINNTQTVLLAFEDVTKKRNFEKQKDEFALIIMHELKNPVSTISVSQQLLQSYISKHKYPELLKYNTTIGEQVIRLNGLINGLLNSSKIRAVGFDFNKEIFDIQELIDETIKNIELGTKNHRILKEGVHAKYVNGDKDRIAQVLINLLINAIRYSPNASKIIVRTNVEKGKIIISVQDFGIGISLQNQKKVFGRFFRLKDTSKKTFYGIGLGLDISSQIVRYHKGKMWLESKEGNGSTFFFSLPISKLDEVE